MKPLLYLLVLPALLLTLSACGSSSSQPAAASATTIVGNSPSSASSPTTRGSSSGGSSAQSCPTQATMTDIFGTSYPPPQVESGDGDTECSYSGTSNYVNVVVGFAHVAMTQSLFQGVAQQYATTYKTTPAPLSGLGEVALLLHASDASSNANGIATTVILIETNYGFIDIIADADETAVENLAKEVVG